MPLSRQLCCPATACGAILPDRVRGMETGDVIARRWVRATELRGQVRAQKRSLGTREDESQRRRRAMSIAPGRTEGASSVGAAPACDPVLMPLLRSLDVFVVGFYRHGAPTALETSELRPLALNGARPRRWVRATELRGQVRAKTEFWHEENHHFIPGIKCETN